MKRTLSKIEQNLFSNALDNLGIVEGDNLFVHSDLLHLGFPLDGKLMYLDTLKHKIGKMGSLFAPAFTFSFLREHEYDYKLTRPINMGFLSDQLLSDPNSCRSKHPINSILMYGPLANKLNNIETLSAYAEDGIFAKLLDHNVKIVLLGARPDHISYSHFSEELFSVPYRKFLSVQGSVRFSETDERENCVFQFFGRNLEIDPVLGGYDTLVKELIKEHKWTSTNLQGCTLYSGLALDYVQHLNLKLAENPAWLIEKERFS